MILISDYNRKYSKILNLSFFLFLIMIFNPPIFAEQPWMDASITASERADLLLEAMTAEQKVAMCHGAWGAYTGNVPGIPELGIPALCLSDGPQGARIGPDGNVTCFAAPITLAASWNVDLALAFGRAYGAEQKGKGTNITLAPMMNLSRIPQGGRNWEGYGEDPFLSACMAAAEVKGIQSNGIIACAKHFIGNEQETNRGSNSSAIDDRTLHEVYLQPFKACIEAGAGSLMGAYNKVNWTYSCENSYIMNTVIYGELGFKGFIMSDWGATHSTVPSANNGLSLEMPGSGYFGGSLLRAVKNGDVSPQRLNLMVKRILVPMFEAGLFDRKPEGSTSANVTSPSHTQTAQDMAAQGLVLLKNTGNFLPLGGSIKKIALIGEAADSRPIVTGGGSGNVPYTYMQLVTAKEGIKDRAGSQFDVAYDAGTVPGRATSVAAGADIAVVVVGVNSSEAFDRLSLSLPADHGNRLIKSVAAARKTIVVVYSPAQVLMPWADDPNIVAILWGGLPGQEQGNALAKILFGDINPSGKLPLTFAEKAADYVPAGPEHGRTVWYSERLLIGYRGFDSRNTAPLFPFGHGLSYTTFGYSDLQCSSTSVTFMLTNTGIRDGAEVAQLYLGFPESAGEPPRQLKGFKRIFLNAGKSQAIDIPLTDNELSIWDIQKKKWAVPEGTFKVYVGSSSRDIRLTGSFQVDK
ncbi:MAG: glycoside hydrolase family 3 C-terminal domain-containing protein [Spirochaetales bacterium]|nr:glycoside hydrolase family 3 C-terminal domain-containing protein [Spirochaetales bacterium]